MPQKSGQKKEKNKTDDTQIFWIEGYKVLIGRNKKENKKLLALAKANDIWMHIQNTPSSHVIIKTDKQSIPGSVIRNAAKLCVDFSTSKAGEYKVDFTKRKFVKPQEEANVFYTNYETIIITKEGVEIRS
jgi:predicted ribosome quality control (RQC) complex YloA/Tae2 family protein